MNFIQTGRNSPHSGNNSVTASHATATMPHTALATALTAAATSHMRPFKLIARAHNKRVKPFYSKGA